jgi:hypothetical protein
MRVTLNFNGQNLMGKDFAIRGALRGKVNPVQGRPGHFAGSLEYTLYFEGQ